MIKKEAESVNLKIGVKTKCQRDNGNEESDNNKLAQIPNIEEDLKLIKQ